MTQLKTYARVCIPCSTYALTFYLLMSSKQEIENTCFFFSHTIPEPIRKKFSNVIFIDLNDFWHRSRYLLAPYTFIKRKIQWPFLDKADIYGLDFYWDLLRGLKMNYIEDSPNVLDIWETSRLYESYQKGQKESTIKRKIKQWLFGKYYQCPVGTSSAVKAIYTSSPYNKPYHQGKSKIVIDLKQMWENSDTQKKEFILNIFNLTANDLQILKSRNVILLTQPYVEDKKMSEEQLISIYNDIINKYGTENVLIKPHPRDKRDYKHFFPNTILFNKSIPMQLLVLLGVNYKHIVTINSSSALSFGINAPIDWWAEKLDANIVRDEGFCTLAIAKNKIFGIKN